MNLWIISILICFLFVTVSRQQSWWLHFTIAERVGIGLLNCEKEYRIASKSADLLEITFVGLISSYRCYSQHPLFVFHAKDFSLLKSSCVNIIQSILLCFLAILMASQSIWILLYYWLMFKTGHLLICSLYFGTLLAPKLYYGVLCLK